MYVGNKITATQVNFLASSKFQAFTYQVDATGITADANGRKIVKAGTIYPLNDATAVGIVYNDIDVTEGPQPASVIVEGYILEQRLPVAPVAAAKTALKEIKFR